MNLSRRWRRVFSLAIIAVMIGSMMAVFPVFREAGAQTISPTNTAAVLSQQVLAGSLINVSVLLNEVTYVGVSGNTIYLAMPANSSVLSYVAYNVSSNWSKFYEMLSNTTALMLQLNKTYGIQIDAAITDGRVGIGTTTPLTWGSSVQETFPQGTSSAYVGIDVYYANLTNPILPKTVTVTLNAINTTTGITQLVNVVVYVMNSTVPMAIPGIPSVNGIPIINSSTVNAFKVYWPSISGADKYLVKVYYENYTSGASPQFLGEYFSSYNYTDAALLEANIPALKNGILNGTYKIFAFPYNATWGGGIYFPGGELTFEVDAIPPSAIVNKADLFVTYTTSGWQDNLTAVDVTLNGTITLLKSIQITVKNNAGTVLTQGASGYYNLTIDYMLNNRWVYFEPANYTNIGVSGIRLLIVIGFNESYAAFPWYKVSVKIMDYAGNYYYLNYTLYNITGASSSLVMFEDSKNAGEALTYANYTVDLPNGKKALTVNITDTNGVEWFPISPKILVKNEYPSLTDVIMEYAPYPGTSTSFINGTTSYISSIYLAAPNGEYVVYGFSLPVYVGFSTSITASVPAASILAVNGHTYSINTFKVSLPLTELKSSINVTAMIYDTAVGGNSKVIYSILTQAFSASSVYTGATATYTIADKVSPWVSPKPDIYAVAKIPVTTAVRTYYVPVNVPLNSGNIPKGEDVVFEFTVNDTHLEYFNISFQAAGDSVSASIQFPDRLAATAAPVATLENNGVPYFYIVSVELSRNTSASFDGYPVTSCWDVKVIFHINESLPATATTLAYSWSAVDYGLNKVSYGPYLMDITNNTISATGETVAPIPHGGLHVSWAVSNSTRYAGFAVIVYNYTANAFGKVPSPQGTEIWAPATSINLTYDQIIHTLDIGTQYNGTTNVTICVISNDGHYGIVTSYGIVDNEVPEVVNVTMTNNTGYVNSPVVGADVLKEGAQFTMFMNVTDKYTGVAKIVVDASSVNSTGTFTYLVGSPTGGAIVPWQVTITVDKSVTGKEPITIYYYDAAGNVKTVTFYVYVDNSPPQVTYVKFPEKVSAGSIVGVTVNAADEPAGLTMVNVSIGSFYNVTTFSTALASKNATYNVEAPTTVGTYTVYVTVEDMLGHKATYAVGTIHVYPAAPSGVSVVVKCINGKETRYTPSTYNVVYVGDSFRLVATLKDQYGNVIPSKNVKLQWKIVVENSSGSAVPVDVPAYGDYAVFKALTMGKIEFEVYLLQYISPINGSTINVTTPVSGTIMVYVIPGVNKVVVTPAKTTLTVGTSTTVKVQTYYVDHSGKYFTSPVPAPFAKVNITASAGTAPCCIQTNNTGGYEFTYTAPEHIGVPYTTVTLTASADAGTSVQLTVVAGTPAKIEVTPSTTTTVATVPVKFTVSLYDQYGNPAYGTYNVSISALSGASMISSVPAVVVYNNGSVSFTLYTTASAYGTIELNVTYNSTVYQTVKVTVLPLPDQAKITAPSEVAAYTGYNITVYVYNSTYGIPTPGALVKLYEQSPVYGLKYVGEAVTNANGYATVVYYPSLFKQNTNVTLIAKAYVNGTMIVQSTATVLVKAYWPKVLIEKVVGPVPLAGQNVQPGRPFYIDITLKSETYLPTNITVYVSLYKSGTGIEAGEWLITTAYVELGPNAEKTVRIFMILPYNAPTGNWTMVITLHDWNRFIKYGPQGSVLPWAGSRTYIVFYVAPPSTGTGTIQATEIYWRRFD